VATRTSNRRTKHDEGTKQRDVVDQPTPFLGLFLAPLLATIITWGVHYAIVGWDLWHWHVGGSQGYLGLATAVSTLAAVAVGYSAWHFSYDRKNVWRVALTVSATFVGMWLPLLIWAGPNRYLDLFFALCAWIVSGIWALPRLHTLRRDPREDGDGDNGDELMKSLGIHGYRHKGTPEIQYDKDGDPERIKVKIKHRFGATREPLQAALPNIESAVGGPGGLSRVVRTEANKSNESEMVVILKDPLVGRVPNPGLSNPGGSPSEWATIGMYDDGEWFKVSLLGGIDPALGTKMPPTGYAFMGMTRTGKTVGENRLLLDQVISRRGTVLCYLNKAKGGQDCAPIIAGIEVAVLSDGTRDYRFAMDRIRDIMTYRQKQLARYGFSSYDWEKCFNNPPTHTITGEHAPMEPLPWLIVHVGEADAILAEAGEEAVYIASKGLSLGIVAGWSMQRWAATSMPTDLRYNIGTAFCYGVGDDYSAQFALSESTVKAGARPADWKNRKPGRLYAESIGIDDTRFPVPIKTIGDDDDDALYANMRADAEMWGPRMDKLDRGSAVATRGWWDRMRAETDALRLTLTPGTAARTPPPGPIPAAYEPPTTPAPDNTQEVSVPRKEAKPQFVDDELPDDAETGEEMRAQQEMRQEVEDTFTTLDGREIRGELITPDGDDPTGTRLFDEMSAVNPRAEIPPIDPAEDVEFDDPKPEAPSPEEAQLKFDQSLRDVLADPKFRDPDDPTGRSAIFRTGQLQAMYPFRARSWYSVMLKTMADGDRVCPPGIRLEKVRDRTGEGWYRVVRTDSDD
jgi:hypothetical protein